MSIKSFQSSRLETQPALQAQFSSKPGLLVPLAHPRTQCCVASQTNDLARAEGLPGQAMQPDQHRGFDLAQIEIHGLGAPAVQAKLIIGSANDRFEREADVVAEKVVTDSRKRFTVSATKKENSPAEGTAMSIVDVDSIQRVPTSPYSFAGGMLVSDRDGADTSSVLQTKSKVASQVSVPKAIAADIRELRTGGTPLPGEVRSFMEPRFGYDFGRVRVHADNTAARLARGLNARAFTLGRDVVFGGGQFQPATGSGRQLIAHELTHVIQQRQAPRHVSSNTNGIDEKPSLRVNTDSGSEEIRRVKWFPNQDTGEEWAPWPEYSYNMLGRRLKAETDAGTAIYIWRPYDDETYYCHGFTFRGNEAEGGPYSVPGSTVPTILKDEGWKETNSCNVGLYDILVFSDDEHEVSHTGIITNIEKKENGQIDEERSRLRSKWGWGDLNNESWRVNARYYGRYRCYSKNSVCGECPQRGKFELGGPGFQVASDGGESTVTSGGNHAD